MQTRSSLGRALAAHRAACTGCTPQRGCPAYLGIAREHTAARQIWAGPVAAHTVLSVREAA